MLDLCDFHAHILPNADHGSSSVSISLSQLELASQYGVTRIFATPHFYPHQDSVSSFLKRRDSAYMHLIDAKPEGYPDIVLGAEVLLCPKIDRLPGIGEFCIPGTKTLLLELPFNDFSNEYIYAVEGLVLSGYKIILAHAERYQRDQIEDLMDLGALLQLNAPVLTRFFKSRTVEEWKSRNKVVAIGSDIHGTDKNAYKLFDIAKKKLGPYISTVQTYTDDLWAKAQNSTKIG